MKSKILFHLLFLCFTGAAFAQGGQELTTERICFTDDAGYVWKFDHIVDNGDWTYYATGMVENAYASTSAHMMLDLRNGALNGIFTATAINDYPDGCTQYTDSFIYHGSAQVIRTPREGGGLVATYSGTGTWESYCFGGILSTGTWNAWGPCAMSASKPKVKDGILPVMGKKTLENLKSGHISVVPNPVKSYGNILYNVTAPGKVNVTIFNILQQPVKVLVNENKSAGNYSVTWNALNSSGVRVPAGLYRLVATIGNKVYSTPIQVQ